MDNSGSRDTRQPTRGGVVELSNPAALIQEKLRRPQPAGGERYELRDARSEVTHRSTRLDEILARAEQLGSSRFVEIDSANRRTPYVKADGEWRAEPQRPVEPKPDLASEAGRAASTGEPAKLQVETVAQRPPDSVNRELKSSEERSVAVAKLEASLVERYLIKRAIPLAGDLAIGRTEYRFRGDTSRIAFTESAFKLATDTNSPSVARSMVDVAEARDWKSVQLSGHEDFKRQVWLEATVRGVKALGYEPTPPDLELLQREQEARRRNRIEPIQLPAHSPDKAPSGRGGGGRKTVLAAIEAVLVARNVPQSRREAVLAAAAEKLAERIRAGQAPKVRVYDPDAPSRRSVAPSVRAPERNRERPGPSR